MGGEGEGGQGTKGTKQRCVELGKMGRVESQLKVRGAWKWGKVGGLS